MVRSKSYSLAVEIDRSLKLELNNGRFEALAGYIDVHQDNQKAAQQLMQKSSTEVHQIISDLRKK
jgi:hypothetical protein